MTSSQRTRGECIFCSRDLTSGGFIRHLRSCDTRQKAIQAASQNNRGERSQMLYHLQIKNIWDSDFWLHLEMNGTADLGELDGYLRTIWLECCGHLSQFTSDHDRWGSEISMSRKAGQVLKPGMEMTHIYDFGSPTETAIKTVDVREGKPLSKHPIYLMARNAMPEFTCDECDQTAHWLLEDYGNDYGDWLVALCNAHVDEVSDDDFSEPFEMANSPRLGVCGYMGPAKPPY